MYGGCWVLLFACFVYIVSMLSRCVTDALLYFLCFSIGVLHNVDTRSHICITLMCSLLISWAAG